MKVLRSSFVAAVAIFAAACGDKVNIVQPDTTVQSNVTAVAVAPTAATMSIGQTVSFTSAVTATGTAATTVTWSSTDASKVSVSATGVATAVAATPGVAICATSTVNTNAKGCATVVVSPASTTIPATVSIQAITINGNLNAPVNPGAVAGVIDVRANVSPGTEQVNKVVVMVGTVRADSQTFSAAASAALRYAADQAIAEQSAFPPILFSLNTAKFNPNSGVVTYPNGNYPISVLLYVAGNTNARSTATYQTPLTFVNADGYLATVATSGTVANVNNAAGFRYDRGSITATALPVIYSGRSIAGVTLLFGTNACDASGTGQRNIAAALSNGSWTATLPVTIPTGGAAVNTVNSYEFTNNGICTLNAVGETIAMTATDANGDALFAAAAPINVAAVTSLRLDNRAPQVGSQTLMANPGVRNNGWVNASIGLVTTNSATNSGIVVRPAATACLGGTTARDCGEGSYVAYARIANATGGLVDDARAATATSAPTVPAPSVTPTTYCIIITAQDALGNETARPTAGTACTTPPGASSTAVAANHMMFGVDIAAPTIAFVDSTATTATQGLNANMRRNSATIGNGTGQTFLVTVGDTGIIGNSGMNTGTSVNGTVILRNDATSPALTAAQKCVVGTVSATDGVTCLSASVQAAPAFPLVAAGAAVTGATAAGYYTYNAVGRDAAGNSSAAITRVIAFNPVANVPSLTTALFNVPLTGSTVAFTANSSSNFDLWKSTYTMTYTGGLVGPILYPPAVLNSFNGTQLFSNAPAGITLTGFMRQVEDVTGNAPVAVSGAYKPLTLTGIVTDQANVPSVAAATTIPGASVTTGTSYLNGVTYPAALLTRSWAVTNAATNVSTGAGPAAAVNALSVTLNADAFGATATFNPPFTRVDFYAVVGANLEQIGSTTAFSTFDDGSAFGRRHRWSFVWTPGTTSPISATAWVLGAQNVYAIGVNANGDALVSPVAATITLTNP